MIRPELKDQFWQWREVIGALALAALGIWWGTVSFGVVQFLGWALALIGIGMAIGAAQKVRFAATGEGAGVVTLDERRVTYLGPTTGGVADLDLMVQLDLTPGSPTTPSPAWRLINGDGNYVDIPTNALGVEALFDVFTALPGIKTEYMLSTMARAPHAQMTIWMAPNHKPYTQLH